MRGLIKAEALASLADVDVLITPTMLGTAPTFAGYDFESQLKLPALMSIWNLTGLPALSVCWAKLPIGMQIVGKPSDRPDRVAEVRRRVSASDRLARGRSRFRAGGSSGMTVTPVRPTKFAWTPSWIRSSR